MEASQREARWSLGGDWRRREATCRKRKRGEDGDDGIDGDDGGGESPPDPKLLWGEAEVVSTAASEASESEYLSVNDFII